MRCLRSIFGMTLLLCTLGLFSSCQNDILSPEQSEVIRGHVPPPTQPSSPAGPPQPTSPEPAKPGNTSPSNSDNTLPPSSASAPPKAGINDASAPAAEAPPKETYSERTANSPNKSTDFKPAETGSQSPAHVIIADTVNRLQGGGPVSNEEIEKIVQIVVTRIQSDPAVREALQKLAQNPDNTSLQQKILDFFLQADAKELIGLVHNVFKNVEYYQNKATQYVQTAKNVSAYTGGALGALLLNGLFFQACRAEKEVPLGGHHLPWLLGLALESYYALQFAHSHEAVKSFNGHLGFGLLMGGAIVAQCEGIKAFRRWMSAKKPFCGGGGAAPPPLPPPPPG